MDKITPERRSANMRRIGSKNTTPELIVRRLAYGLGFRYRLHDKTLPGRPDLVFKGKHKVIFVHGCFWHQHLDCSLAHVPKSNNAYWQPKLERNIQRDNDALTSLNETGWESLVIWECEVSDVDSLSVRLTDFLS